MAPVPGGSGEVARRNYWETGRKGPDTAEITPGRMRVNTLYLRPKPWRFTCSERALTTPKRPALFEKMGVRGRGNFVATLPAWTGVGPPWTAGILR